MAQRVAALYAEIDAKTDKFEKGLKGVESGLEGAQGKLGKLGGAFQELTGMDLSKVISVGSIIAVGKALADATQAAANWGDEMGDLAQLTGASVEETSKMSAAFELVGISTGTLQSAIKGLTNAGLQPNFATIKKLSAEYQAIQDPVERNEFLFKKFGRAGLEMAEIMGKSAAELDKLSGAAMRSGKVIGGETADAAEEFNINMAIFKQRVEGAQIAVGNALIPTLNQAATSLDTLVSIGQMWAVDIQRAQGLITEEQARLEKLRIAGIEPTSEATEELSGSTGDLAKAYDTTGMAAYGAARADFALEAARLRNKKATEELKIAEETLSAAISGPIANENRKYIDQQAELRLRKQELVAELEKLQATQGKQVTSNQSSTLSANELNLAELKLAEAQSKLAAETDPLKQAALAVEIDKLNSKISGATVTTTGYIDNSKRIGEIKTELDGVSAAFDANAAAHEEATARIVFGFIQQRMAVDGLQAGEITALAEIGKAWGIYDEETARVMTAVDQSISQHGSNAKAILDDVARALDDLPDVKEVNIRVNTNYQSYGAEPGPDAQVKVTPGSDSRVGKVQAAGGSFIVPAGYGLDSYPLANVQSGERVTVEPSGQVQTYGGDALLQIVQTLPAAIQRAVRDGMQMAMA